MNCIRWCLLAFAFLFGSVSETAFAEKFKLILTTKTGNRNGAGTDDPVYFALYYEGRVPAPNAKARAKMQTVPKEIRIEKNLNNKGDDRKTGAFDTYELEFECPMDKIRRVEIGLKAGEDAWYLEGMQYEIVYQGKRSTLTEIPLGGFISGAANDGPKNARAKQFYWFKVAPPKFPRSKRRK